MQLTKQKFATLLTGGLITVLLAAPGTLWAQGVALDDDDLAPAIEEEAAPREDNGARLGAGLRLRQVHVLRGVLELFFGEVPGNESHIGFGAEFIRKKGNMQFIIGVEYERLDAATGLWLEKGEENRPPEGEPDLVEFDNFGWVGVDFNFMWHTRLASIVHLRYGAGLGIGLVLGEVLRTDFGCPTAELTLDGPNSCDQDLTTAENPKVNEPEDDIPPVFPIVNMVVGLQLQPTDSLAINIEGGIRSLFPFVGTSVSFLF